MPLEAGKGEHRAYLVKPDGSDSTPLTPAMHYLGIDAVSWFINKQSSWFSDRMASGTIDIKIAGGVEHYQAGLGTFELKGGAHTAPVFDRPVLPDRNYVGGVITLNSSLTGLKKDTVVAGLLKSAAVASLGVAAGMVETATAAGPARILGAAGDELIKGVKQVLSDTGEKREPLFDFSGFEVSLQPTRLLGPENYLLFHRGTPFEERQLTIRTAGQLTRPYVDAAALEDGAWLLLRLRRSLEYSGQREWYAAARTLRTKIATLLDDARAGVVSREEALEQLQPSGSAANATIFDAFVAVRAIIFNDGVLTEAEAALRVGPLRVSIEAARKELTEGRHGLARDLMTATREALLTSRPLPPMAAAAYQSEASALSRFRSTPHSGGDHTVLAPSMTKTIEESFRI